MNVKQLFEASRAFCVRKGLKTWTEMRRRNFPILLGLFAVTFIFMEQSPLNILLLNGNSGTDSSVFRTIAMQMKKGLMPYRDSFDHKGPLLYLYNYWGILIRQHRGIWVIEFISAFVTFASMYKIARLKCDRLQAFFVLMICISPLYGYFEGGNLTEEYALPFITIALYIFVDYFMNGRISNFRLGICGLGFGAVCLLRINMIAVWIIFCCAVLFQSLFRKNWKELPRFLFWFLVGTCSIVIPVCCWLVINHAFMDFIRDYFIFNIMYTQDTGRILNKYNTFSFFLNNIYILTAVVITGYVCKDKKLFHWAYLGCEVAGLLLLSMSGAAYPHYGMVMVPVLVYPFSLLMSRETIKKKTWITAFVLYLAVAKVIPTWIEGINRGMGYWLSENKTRERTDTVGKICTYIKDNSDEEDRIIVWGNWNIIYVQSERLPASKYSYQVPIGSIDKTILIDFYEEIEETMPKIVVVANDYEHSDMESFLDRHGYFCTYKVNSYSVYMQVI